MKAREGRSLEYLIVAGLEMLILAPIKQPEPFLALLCLDCLDSYPNAGLVKHPRIIVYKERSPARLEASGFSSAFSPYSHHRFSEARHQYDHQHSLSPDSRRRHRFA